LKLTEPFILPSIPSGGLAAAQTHANVRGEQEFKLIPANNGWTVAIEHWSGNPRQSPWRAHIFDPSGKWRGVAVQAANSVETALKMSLKSAAEKHRPAQCT